MKEGDVALLIAALGGDATAREAAIARLTILGERSVGRLVTAYRDTPDRAVRLAILRVLEAAGDERALDVAQQAIAAGGDLAVGGVAVLRELLGRPRGSADVQALDRLLAVARDPSAPRRVRAAAVEALGSAPEDVRKAVEGLSTPEPAGQALWQDALAGQLPDSPAALRDTIADQAATAPLADLRRLIEAIASREREAPPEAGREWLATRGAVHQALALRGSRIALYDLRETVERASGALPSSFVGALQIVGDGSCLEPLAAAFTRSADPRWQHTLSQAFHEIVKRERLTKRHAAVRKALAIAPGVGGV